MADVFLSYASQDRERVKPLVDAIERAGFSIWWDREIGVGSRFEREIEDQLDSAGCVVVIWSRHSIESDWVRNEAQEGLDRGVLMPVLLDDVKQPLAFRRVQATRWDESFRSLLAAIERNTARAERIESRQTAAHASPSAPLSAIAVMPFDDLSPAGDQAWLADGMAEELIDSLSRIKGLRVPARTSTTVLKENKSAIDAIAGALAVGSLITGSVRRSGNRINVAVQWIRASDQSHLWSARFERRFDDALAIQREIAIGIAEVIRAELGIHDTAEFISRLRYQTSDVRAWELFRRGFDLAFTFQPNKIIEGRELLRQALEIDPDYLDAQTWLAWTYLDEADVRVEGAKQVLQRDPTDPTALVMLADDALTQWDFETAKRLWDRAVATNPQNSLLTLHGHHLLTCLGELEAAVAVGRRGTRLDPQWSTQHLFLGRAYLNRGDPAAAIGPLERATRLGEVNVPLSWHYQSLAFAYQSAGRPSDALDATLRAFPELEGDIRAGWRSGNWRGMNLAVAAALAGANAGRQHSYIVEKVNAQLFASAAETGEMYRLLEKMLQASSAFDVRDRRAFRMCTFIAEALHSDAEFHPYREESPFRALTQQLDERIAGAAGSSGHAKVLSRSDAPPASIESA